MVFFSKNKPRHRRDVAHQKKIFVKPRSKKTLILGPASDTVVHASPQIRKRKLRSYKKLIPSYNRTQIARSLTIFALTLIAILVLFIVFWSNAFRIRPEALSISYRHPELFNQAEIARLLDTFVGDFSFGVSSDTVFSQIQTIAPQLKSVSVSMRLPDGLSVRLESYPPVFRTIFEGRTYFIVRNGAVVPMPSTADSTLPVLIIVGPETSGLFENPYVLKYDEMGFLDAVVQFLHNHPDTFPPLQGIAYYSQEDEIHLISGSRILLALPGDMLQALQHVDILQSQGGSRYLSESYTYIDLRVPERLFACLSTQRTQCETNLKKMYGNFWDIGNIFIIPSVVEENT